MKDLFRIIKIIATEIYFLVFPFSLPFFFLPNDLSFLSKLQQKGPQISKA